MPGALGVDSVHDVYPYRLRCDENCDCHREDTEKEATIYWILPLMRAGKSNKNTLMDSTPSFTSFSSDYERFFLSVLPETFAWVLRYLSATISAKPMEVYASFSMVEEHCFREAPRALW